jgi:hypothetical protein
MIPPSKNQDLKTETTGRGSRQFSWLAAALSGLLIMQITGCADRPVPELAPEGSPAMKQQALSFAPPPGKAGVYVIRPYTFANDTYYGGTVYLFNISLDYQDFGALETNSYLFGIVSSGNHVLGPVHFTAEAGKNYYFTVKGVGFMGSSIRHMQFDPIPETDGQAYVRKFKLSGDNRFELQNPPGQKQW